MIVEDLILRNTNNYTQFRLVINNKFFVSIKPKDFYRNKYREVIKKYMTLEIKATVVEKNIYRNVKKYYVESEDLEKDIIEFENKWYDKNTDDEEVE